MKSVLISLTLFLPIFLLAQDSYNNNQTTCGDKKGITPMFQLTERQSSEDILSAKTTFENSANPVLVILFDFIFLL